MEHVGSMCGAHIYICSTFAIWAQNANGAPYMLLLGAHLQYRDMQVTLLLYLLENVLVEEA